MITCAFSNKSYTLLLSSTSWSQTHTSFPHFCVWHVATDRLRCGVRDRHVRVGHTNAQTSRAEAENQSRLVPPLESSPKHRSDRLCFCLQFFRRASISFVTLSLSLSRSFPFALCVVVSRHASARARFYRYAARSETQTVKQIFLRGARSLDRRMCCFFFYCSARDDFMCCVARYLVVVVLVSTFRFSCALVRRL